MCVVTHTLRCAYVHHTNDRDRLVNAVLERLRGRDVVPIGRYGLWDYTSMEDSMESAQNCCVGGRLMQYSIVIPAHNEASNLEAQVVGFIKGLPKRYR